MRVWRAMLSCMPTTCHVDAGIDHDDGEHTYKVVHCLFASIGRGLTAFLKNSPLSEIESPLSGLFSQWLAPG